jgi:hypothetical protein
MVYGRYISGIGLIVLLGWILGWSILMRLHPSWVTMKPITAVGLILCGIIIECLGRAQSHKRDLVLGIISFQVYNLSLSLLLFQLLRLNLGIESLLYREPSPLHTVGYTPSIMTSICLALVATAGVAELFNAGRIVRNIGRVLLALSTMAICGYFIGVPILYYYIPTISTAIALHSAIGFFICGAALVIVSKKIPNKKWGGEIEEIGI